MLKTPAILAASLAIALAAQANADDKAGKM